MTARKTKSAPSKVGSGNPPRHTHFRKGRSGNPRGRPPRDPAQRLNALTLQEAYRATVVREDGRAVPVTSIEAILRSEVELAAKGNVQAQRAILAAVRRFEKEDKEAAELAAIRPRIYGRESAASTCEREPDAAERDGEEWDRQESDAAGRTGDEAHSTNPDSPPKFPVPSQEFPGPHGTGNSAEPVDEQ